MIKDMKILLQIIVYEVMDMKLNGGKTVVNEINSNPNHMYYKKLRT